MSRPPAVPPRVAALGARFLRRYSMAPDLPWPEQRVRMAKLLTAMPLPAGTARETVTIAGVAAERVRATEPASPGATRLLLHFHGGGYCVGLPAMAAAWAGALAVAAGVEVVLPDYRLAPEHPFPAALDDALSVWSSLTDGDGVDPGTICVSGDSAGGGLALALALALRDAARPLPSSMILVSPWLDLTANRRADAELVARDPLLSPEWLASAARAYAGATGLDDPRVSPLLADPTGLPPMLIQAGVVDIIATDSIRLAASVRATGGQVTLSLANGLFHDFPLQVGALATADSSIRQAAAFLRAT